VSLDNQRAFPSLCNSENAREASHGFPNITKPDDDFLPSSVRPRDRDVVFIRRQGPDNLLISSHLGPLPPILVKFHKACPDVQPLFQPTMLSKLVFLASLANAAVHTIDVGEGGLTFNPQTVEAASGDTLIFHLYPQHDVVQGTFGSPCTASSGGFYSGPFSSTDSGYVIFPPHATQLHILNSLQKEEVRRQCDQQ
jgi:hypothetical protein